MKNLFVVAVATGIFAGTSISVKAQTNVNLEKFSGRQGQKPNLQFIDGIEITPERKTTVVSAGSNATAPVATNAAANTTTTTPTFASSIEKCIAIQFKFAMLMDIEVELIRNLPLYRFIEDWWGTRYRYGGTDRSGIDCSSFTGKLTEAIYGISMPRTAREQFRVCDKVPTDELLEGDLVFFNTRGGISHVGVYLINNFFVHSSTHGGVTISSLTEPYYSEKFVCGGRPVIPVQ